MTDLKNVVFTFTDQGAYVSDRGPYTARNIAKALRLRIRWGEYANKLTVTQSANTVSVIVKEGQQLEAGELQRYITSLQEKPRKHTLIDLANVKFSDENTYQVTTLNLGSYTAPQVADAAR